MASRDVGWFLTKVLAVILVVASGLLIIANNMEGGSKGSCSVMVIDDTSNPVLSSTYAYTAYLTVLDNHDYIIVSGNGTGITHSASCRKCNGTTEQIPQTEQGGVQ